MQQDAKQTQCHTMTYDTCPSCPTRKPGTVIGVLALLISVLMGSAGFGATDTTTTLTSDASSSVYGQTVTFTATVDPVPDGGNVVFKASGIPIGTVAANTTTGVAQLPFNTLQPGTYSMTAEYSGTTNYNGSTSAPLSQTVNKADTSLTVTSDGPDPSVVGQAYTVHWSVAVVAPGGGPLAPTGLVQVNDGNGNTCSAEVSTGECTLPSTSAGAKTITATYAGDANYNGSSDTEPHTVNKADTTLTLATFPDPSAVGETVTLTADVATVAPGGGSPTGTVTFKIGTTLLGTGGLVSTGANTSQAVITTSTISSGTHTITAEYTGSSNYNGSNDTEGHEVAKRNTTTMVFGSSKPLVVGDPVTCTVTVAGTSPGEAPMPTGMVTVGVSPTGQGSPVSWSHPLIAADAGQFTFTYTPSSATTTPHTFTATYVGNSTYDGSNGAFAQAIIKRAVDVQLICSPVEGFIGQAISCQVVVSDDTTAGSYVTPDSSYVTLSDDRWVGAPRFSAVAWSASGGKLIGTFTYTPAAWDTDSDQALPWNAQAQATATITASYAGSPVHTDNSATQPLTVNLRPTQTMVLGSSATLLVNQQHSGGTVDVTDVAGVGTATAPAGTLAYSSSLPVGYATITPTWGLAPSDTFAYLCYSLDAAAGFDTVRVDYTATDGIHANSAGAFGQGVQRRPTVTTLSGCAGTATGCTCTATVTEKAGNPGGAVPIAGDLAALSPATTFSGAAPSWGVTTTTNSLIAIVSVSFTATDKVHLNSTALANVDRSAQFPSAGGDGSTGADCDDGCGSGGRNVDEIIMGINAAELALTIVQMGLETFATVLDVIPDVVTGGGVFVIVGVTIPISDIVAAVVAGAGIAIDIAVTTMTTDLDGDGIPGVVEATIGTSDIKVDSDGDGMGDADEISEAGGWCGGSRRPNPLVKDSDGDGLEDGEEGQYGTSVCVKDTDCDTLSDGDEVATWQCGDARNHADPLMVDTDGDGLPDSKEDINTTLPCSSCPYVNDDDSDDDGLQDGYEDKSKDGQWGVGGSGITIGTSTTQASKTVADWETHLCGRDTDSDGLSDGQEEWMFGAGEVTPWGVSVMVGVQGPSLGNTVPALDSDMDNDGLSDEAETNTYQTDPMDADTDNDMISDGAEVATWASGDSRNHSNPREADTDGDGLTDNLEIALGCPYVNDDDSDDDGLQDGYEDKSPHDGIITYTIGYSTTQGSGETHFCIWDTDGDGLSDGEEEGLFGPGAVTAVTSTGAVNTIPALDDDSDNDGLSDWEEVNVTGTNPLHWDTDGDGISDSNELIATGGGWPKRTFDQESDPLDRDTDDDGLPDAIEYPGTGLGITRTTGGTRDTTCPYVNDADSDDDGVQDGYEDKNKDGIWNNYAIGNSTLQGSGETCACIADSDSDGFQDGEEEGLLGRTATPRGVSTIPGQDGTALGGTVPALDDDSDNDGLSDYEEVNTTGTNPLDADTDNDTISDANELIATGGGWPKRTFDQESDPLDRDTDDDGLPDAIEYPGTGLGITRTTGGTRDTTCPYVNDADSDDDGLEDGVEDANHDGVWSGITIGSFGTQASKSGEYWETNPCNPDTDGDGLLDGEEVALLGGGPISERPAGWPNAQPVPGFNTVTPEGVSTVVPVGPSYGGGPLYTFTPTSGAKNPANATVPALDVDSDNDGLSDYEEVNITATNALDADTDNDTLADADELVATGGTYGAHPQRTFDQESDPLDINTDDDYLFDPVEGSCAAATYAGTGLSTRNGELGGLRDTACPYVNNPDSDADGVQDGAVIPISRQGPGMTYAYTFIEGFLDVPNADIEAPGTVRTVVTPATGEQDVGEQLCNVCDSDSDGDGLTDGQEIGLGTNPQDWDTDDDGRNDWHEVTGGGPIPTDPFDPDTDDDGLLDSAEVFGTNTTNPVNADTDGDGLCDGGAGTPYMVSGHPTVTVNPICKSCSTPGLAPCATLARAGSADGIGDHPNPRGYGEDKNGNGSWDIGPSYWTGGETDPNQFDTDGDADGDGVEVLGFSTPRQSWIPLTDLFGRAITVTYPACGSLDPLKSDTDGDLLEDGYEDRNHDGNFDFLPSEFDHADPLPGPPIPYPTETNPCDPDTDHDGLNDYDERYQPNPTGFFPFNPTNPLDHDTDNDWLTDGYEVNYTCVALTYTTLDNDTDGLIDEDPIDGLDNDGDGLIDEDPVDFTIRFVPVLDPTNRDSDSDGFIDGLDENPCNSELIPLLAPVQGEPVDSDKDGFSDLDEVAAGTHPNGPDDHPVAYCQADLDFDGSIDDRIWLEPSICCGQANSVVIDLDSNVLIDLRLMILPRNVKQGDFDGDGNKDDVRYTVEYGLSNYRVLQPRVLATIDDYDGDLVIDHVLVERK